MKNDLLKDLNTQQQLAVIQTEGPMIILAGAGSGKTRVLTYKVLFLMDEKSVSANNILMVTFTNKAANEMKERITKFLQPSAHHNPQPLVSTFHSLCARILRIEGKHIGLGQNFIIYDPGDQIETIKDAMKLHDISTKEYKPGAILGTISSAKNEMLSPEKFASIARGHFQETTALIYTTYQSLLKERDAVDFDDLINLVIHLFNVNTDILEKYQNKFRYILVDEYQDTNKAQYALTMVLAKKHHNICVVGDFSQSIYSWRGADFHNLSRFVTDFPNVKTFELSQNYRSTQNILDAASTVIKKNTTHPVLSLWTENEIGEDITIYEAKNEQDEALYIAGFIQNYGLVNLKNIAVLYRTNAQSRVFEEVLIHYGIPYLLVGGTRFYERKEVKDVLSYLRLIANSKDIVSSKRIEKLGKTRMKKFMDYRENVLLNSFQDPNGMPKQVRHDIATLDLLDNIIQKTGYLELYDENDEIDRGRLENIKELRSVAMIFPALNEFLENVALVEQESMPGNKNIENQKNAVTLMTLHAAKGLEFPIVFMVGMEEGLFPHSRSLMNKHELEEERRLAYVGMTRAMKKLFLSYARRRLFFGQRNNSIISRFILELPEKTLQKSLNKIVEFNDGSPEFL